MNLKFQQQKILELLEKNIKFYGVKKFEEIKFKNYNSNEDKRTILLGVKMYSQLLGSLKWIIFSFHRHPGTNWIFLHQIELWFFETTSYNILLECLFGSNLVTHIEALLPVRLTWNSVIYLEWQLDTCRPPPRHGFTYLQGVKKIFS